MTTLHEYCTAEYMLTAMLAGTYSVAVVPVLQGAIEAVPKALLPIAVTLLGRLMLVRLLQYLKVSMPIATTPDGTPTDSRPAQPENA